MKSESTNSSTLVQWQKTCQLLRIESSKLIFQEGKPDRSGMCRQCSTAYMSLITPLYPFPIYPYFLSYPYLWPLMSLSRIHHLLKSPFKLLVICLTELITTLSYKLQMGHAMALWKAIELNHMDTKSYLQKLNKLPYMSMRSYCSWKTRQQTLLH